MNKTARIRFGLFSTLAISFVLFQPEASISQTSATPRVPSTATMGHALPVLPSPVIPSQRARMKAASNVKGAEPQSLQLYNSGDPSVDEQYYLELLNAARMNPPAAGVGISNTTDPDVTSEFTYWDGQDANEPTRARIKSDFATYQPKQPLAMNASLLTAARAHSQDMLDSNYQGHQGTDGSWPWDRAQKAGYPTLGGGSGSPYVGENAAAYAVSVYDAYAGWLIDFGVPNDTQWGHRNNCLEFRGGSDTINPGYTECGPGMIPDPGEGYPMHTGPLVSTLDLGDAGKHFILGVVYADQNQNGLYDPGEGISGVRIDVTGASYYAVSATQGGYAIPFSGSGTVTVKATGGPFGTAGVTQSVNFDGSQNVKVDFSPDLTGFPTQVSLATPSNDSFLNAAAVVLVWDTMPIAAKYYIQIATDPSMQNIIKKDSTKAISYYFSNLKDSTTYYWRVQAKNSKGTGPWSAIDSFVVALPPSAIALSSPANGANVGDSDLTLIWHKASKGGYTYGIEVATDMAMKNTIWTDTLQSDANDTSDVILASNLQPGQTYYWQVSAYNDFGWGSPSAVQSFAVATSSVAAIGENADAPVAVSPNPSGGMTHVRFTLAHSENVSLFIFNSAGEEMNSFDLGRLSAGPNDITLDGSRLPAGSYALQLRMGDRVENAKIVIIK